MAQLLIRPDPLVAIRRSPLLRRSFTTFHKVSSFEGHFHVNIHFQSIMSIAGMDEMTTMLNLLQGNLMGRQLTLDLSRAQTKIYAATKLHYIS